MTNENEQQNILQWMLSERLYEKYFFFYSLIIAVFVILGVFTLGFELDGKTPAENFALNVLWCFILTFFISFTPFYYRGIFGRNSRLLQNTIKVRQQLDSIVDIDERKQARKTLASNGKLPPTTWQFIAMVFIAWYLLFEFCIVSALVRDYQLVWEPQWLQSLIEWGIENTRTPAELPPAKGGRYTLFYANFTLFDFFEHPPFSTMTFTNEQAFLHSSVGHVVMTFGLWRLFIVPLVLIAFVLVFAKMLGWLGLNGLNILYAKNVVDFFGRLFFNLLVFIFLLTFFYNMDLSNSAESMISESAWTGGLSIRLMMFIFTLIPVLLIIGWITWVFQLFVKFKNFIY